MNFKNFGTKSKSDLLDEKSRHRLHGKDIWTVLHTSSVYLPEKPTQEELSEFASFVNGVLVYGTKFNNNWSSLYNEYIKASPFNFTDRENSMISLCNLHNYVNIKLEKDLFECTKENLAKRWGNYANISGNIKTNQNIL